MMFNAAMSAFTVATSCWELSADLMHLGLSGSGAVSRFDAEPFLQVLMVMPGTIVTIGTIFHLADMNCWGTVCSCWPWFWGFHRN